LRCFLIENEDLVRVSEVNLKEGHRPVRSGVVNNRIAVVGVGALLDLASCVNDYIAVVAPETLLESAIC